MLKKYFNKVLLYNILIAIGVVVVLLLIVQSGLKSYTRHDESVTVPDLRGSTFEQVKEILGSKNLEYQIMDSVYDMSKPPMSIIDQNPKPKSKVKEGRTIYITINATKAPTTEIPDLIGRSSLKYAKMQLESYGLKVGELVYKPDPHLNAVIGMMVNGKNVTKKMRVARGTVIDIVLGDGLGNSRISVPYLIGLHLDEAIFKMRGYSLNSGAIIADEGVTDTMNAIIYKQVPAYGDGNTIRIGEPIDLFVAKELPEGITVETELYDKMDSIAAPE
ncbi:MAG TPA: PASTA domain-containing protein [Chitinophagales bacterium]|nr:PASTA domain-containing protein [Chitinophagales bacterium]